MNIVYPYKHFNPAELIYSLKSLKNYKDAGEVFIIGDSPRNDITGFTLIEHEPATWAGCSRYHDVASKIYQYAKTHTGDFLLMNDDMFLLSDYTPTNYYRSKLLDGLRQGNMTSYKRDQVYMLNWLRRQGLPLLSYELHVPMVINCEKAIETIELMAGTIQFGNILMFRTVYGNMHLTDAEQLNDVKNIADYYGKPLLSTNEQTFEHGEIGKYIRTVLDGGKATTNIAVITRLHYADESMFAKRLEMYKTTTLPSLKNQTDKDFDIWVWCEPKHDSIFHRIGVKTFHVNVRPEMQPVTKYYTDFAEWSDVSGLPEYDIQVGIDSDDYFQPGTIAKIKELCIGDRSIHISFQPQIEDSKTGMLYSMKRKYNENNGSPMYAFYQPNKDDYLFSYRDGHIRLPRKAQNNIILPVGYAVMTIHDNNETTGLKDAITN